MAAAPRRYPSQNPAGGWPSVFCTGPSFAISALAPQTGRGRAGLPRCSGRFRRSQRRGPHKRRSARIADDPSSRVCCCPVMDPEHTYATTLELAIHGTAPVHLRCFIVADIPGDMPLHQHRASRSHLLIAHRSGTPARKLGQARSSMGLPPQPTPKLEQPPTPRKGETQN